MPQHFAPREAGPVTVLPALPEPSSADETNHRVANSLQLLAAMVSIEARRIVDPAAVAALDITLRRITAIAGVHRQLYLSRAAATVDLRAYLEDLGAELEQSCADAGMGRRVLVFAEALDVAPEVATSLGVIVSELVSNACKYAYAAGEPGEVRIALRGMPFGGYSLDVSDRGRGIVPGASARGSGLGSQLIAMMANRLGGRFGWLDAQPGTCFTLHVGKQ
jgi:two-component sensor histidine kinase